MSTPPKTLTVTECHQLLDALIPKKATTKQHQKGIRNYTMALLMLDAGLRVGEVVKLQWQQLWLFDRPVNAIALTENQTKTKKPRTIPLSSRAQNAVVEMNKNWWGTYDCLTPVLAFYKTKSPQCLTTRQVERIIRKAAMDSIGRPVHPHVLRHTFATRLMRTTNARIVQELLGHKYISSTQIYTHPNQEDLKRAIERLNELPPITTVKELESSLGPDSANHSDTSGTNGNVG